MRFKNKTKGGYEYRIYARDGDPSAPIHGAVFDQSWISATWNSDGVRQWPHRADGYADYNLLPDIPDPIDTICEYDSFSQTFRGIDINEFNKFAGSKIRLRIEVVE